MFIHCTVHGLCCLKYVFLQTAAPKQWIACDGKVTKMDTPFTVRAQQLRDLYNSVTLTGLSRDERLDVLLTLKCTVKVPLPPKASIPHSVLLRLQQMYMLLSLHRPQEHDCTLTRDIVELVDREADLLVRGMKEETLQGELSL